MLPCITSTRVRGGRLTSQDLLYRAGQRLRRRVIAQSIRDCKMRAETSSDFFSFISFFYIYIISPQDDILFGFIIYIYIIIDYFIHQVRNRFNVKRKKDKKTGENEAMSQKSSQFLNCSLQKCQMSLIAAVINQIDLLIANDCCKEDKCTKSTYAEHLVFTTYLGCSRVTFPHLQ